MSNISFKNISKKYGNMELLKDISFECNNEILYLAGANGVGKTTLIKIALGIEYADAGKVSYDNKKIAEQYCNISSVLDEPSYYPNISGEKNLSIFTKKAANRMSILQDLHLDDSLLRKPLKSYSLGQIHRFAIAIALINNPKYIFLDEPTIGLDPISWNIIKNCITKLAERDCSIIITGHDYDEIEQISDKFIILKDKRIVYTATKSDVIKQNNKDVYFITIDRLSLEIKEKFRLYETIDKSYFLYITTLPDARIEELFIALSSNNVKYSNLEIKNSGIKNLLKRYLEKEQ